VSVDTDNPIYIVMEHKRKLFGNIEGRSDKTWADIHGQASGD
jgi:hypothetical protein